MKTKITNRTHFWVFPIICAAVLVFGSLMSGCGIMDSLSTNPGTETTAATETAANTTSAASENQTIHSKDNMIKGSWTLVGNDKVEISFGKDTGTIVYNGKSTSGSYSVDDKDNLVFEDVTYSFSEISADTDLKDGKSPLSGKKWYVNDDYLVIGKSVYKNNER